MHIVQFKRYSEFSFFLFIFEYRTVKILELCDLDHTYVPLFFGSKPDNIEGSSNPLLTL